MVHLILTGLAVVGTILILWPNPKLRSRRGSIYQRSFDEMFTVTWSLGLFSFDVTYVKAHGSYYTVNSNHVSLADVVRKASNFEAKELDELLDLDLRTLVVSHILDKDSVLVVTKSGAKFDLELEERVWHFRHSSEPILSMHLTNRIFREMRKRESLRVISRYNRNAF